MTLTALNAKSTKLFNKGIKLDLFEWEYTYEDENGEEQTSSSHKSNVVDGEMFQFTAGLIKAINEDKVTKSNVGYSEQTFKNKEGKQITCHCFGMLGKPKSVVKEITL